MKDAQVVDVLDITLSEAQGGTVLLGNKVQGIQCFCLSFCDRRDILGSRLGQEAGEITARVLYDYTFGG